MDENTGGRKVADRKLCVYMGIERMAWLRELAAETGGKMSDIVTRSVDLCAGVDADTAARLQATAEAAGWTLPDLVASVLKDAAKTSPNASKRRAAGVR